MAKSWTTKSSQVLINIFTTLYSELRNNKKIYMKLLKFKLLMLSFLLTSTLLAEDLSSLQQKKLVSGLNYLQYSTAKIKLSENKAIAEDVYYSIINELKLEGISNRDLNFEYSEFLAKCANLKLVQNEKDFIKQLNEKQQNSACLSAFSNLTLLIFKLAILAPPVNIGNIAEPPTLHNALLVVKILPKCFALNKAKPDMLIVGKNSFLAILTSIPAFLSITSALI